MQESKVLPQFFESNKPKLLSSRFGKLKKLYSSSYDSLTVLDQTHEVNQTKKRLKRTFHSITSEDLAFLKMASEAVNVDTNSSFIDELNAGIRRFRSESTESLFSIDFLYNRTDDQVRSEYIERLKYLKVLKEEHTKPHQTLIIFDWDDTFLPTSYLYYVGLDKITPELEKKLQILDKNVTKLLSKAAKIGHTYIVTNGAESWVESSSKVYLPNTYRRLQQKDVTVISARAEYEEEFPDNPKRWKTETFLDIGGTMDSRVVTNILCMGDSDFEMSAAGELAKKFNKSLVKTIKLKECPSAEELIKQIEIVLEKFDQIYTTLRTLTIKLEKKS